MSSGSDPAASRPTNGHNSVNASTPGLSGSGSDGDNRTVESAVSEFYAKYPDRAQLQLTERDGETLRREYVRGRWTQWTSEPADEHEKPVSGSQQVAADPFQWVEAIEVLLENYQDTKRTTINLEKGRPGTAEYETYSVDASNRWMPEYQKRYYAQLEGWMRELTGGDRPSGGHTEASFNDPHIVLITRSGSSVPAGDRLAPVDHWSEINAAWSGSRDDMDGSVYDTLRNTMRSLGYEWQYERRLEPHTGKRGDSTGTNLCYGHEHIVLVVDGPVTESDFRPVLEKHVELCDTAGRDAHRVGDAVEVFEPDEVENIASYVASYANIEPTDLFERSIEYIAWASMMDAANLRTKSRSDAANWASTADSCKQRYESSKSDQKHNHGEKIVPSNRRGVELECAECGSPHGIDQDQTLSAARMSDSTGPTAAADGGFECSRIDEAKENWSDAKAFAAVGETLSDRRLMEKIRQYLERRPRSSVPEILGALDMPPSKKHLIFRVLDDEYSSAISFSRPPSWRVRSVEIGEDEYPASSGNGIEMVEVSQSEKGSVKSDVWSGRSVPGDDEIQYLYRRGKPGETVECAATGEMVDAGNGHLVVVCKDENYYLRDISALSEWVID